MRTPAVFTRASVKGAAAFRGGRAARMLPNARLGGPMPWVIAIMVALTVLAAGAALALNNVTRAAQAELAGGVTVQIVEADKVVRDAQAQRAASALAVLPSVAGVSRVPQVKVRAMVEPWLGADADSTVIPLPALIDLRLHGPADKAVLAQLREELRKIAPSARVDPQANWLGPVFSALDTLRWLAISLIALLAFTSAAAVWLAARNALDGNRETIEIVHHLGGTDAQIARIFQRSVLSDSLLGGIVGLGMGWAALALLANRFAALDSGLVGAGGLGWKDWLLIALVPVLTCILALSTARLTVMASLRKML